MALSTGMADQWNYREQQAAEFFCSTIVWTDILSSALTGIVPKMADEYRNLLKNRSIHLPEVVGVETWVLLEILNITLLEDWKKRENSNGMLSIRELAKRVSVIESTLQERLQTHHLAGPGGTSQQDTTYIFASAALVYLHVVASGARAGVPEIQEAVTRTLDLFSQVRDSRTLQSLMWPYCISACLAGHQQRQHFREVLTFMDDEKTVNRSLQVQAIVEECWSISDSTENHSACDWRTSMDRLNLHILLM
jgi:hypothetical protein